MAGRDRVRYILCEASSPESFGRGVHSDKILSSFRERVRSLWGELGLATFGFAVTTGVVYNFLDFCGIFVLRVPAKAADKCQAAVSSMIELHGRPVTVRVVLVSGRLSNTVKIARGRLLMWRNSVGAQYEVSRKAQLDDQLRGGLALLEKGTISNS